MPDQPRLRTPSQETMLLDLVQRLEKRRMGRFAVHIHLSELSNAYGRDRYTEIARESFSRYVSGFQGQLFPLQNGDLFFVSKDTPRPRLEESVTHLQQLFSLDPLLQRKDERGRAAFATWYSLWDDYEDLLRKAEEILREAETREEEKRRSAFLLSEEAQPIGPAILSKLEQSLETADVSSLARRQTVCTIIEGHLPQPLFEEIFISMDDLQQVVTPGIDLSANVWLFRYLTRTFDKRLMRMLLRDGIRTNRPFSLNLNVATVLTPEFATFEAAIAPQLRGRLVIEMNKLDVFSDMGAFLFARDYLHDHGFRLCLDGLTHHTLRYYDRAMLGFDLVKLFWAPGAVEDMLPAMMPEVRAAVRDTGQANTILCRCDSPRAIETGQELGIVMFQGFEVDRILGEASPLKW